MCCGRYVSSNTPCGASWITFKMEISLPDKKTILKIIAVGLIYIVLVNFYTFVLFKLGLTSLKTSSLREIFFGVWGYGWDGMHYTKIALHGYEYPLMAFFPLYPILIVIADFVLPLSIAYRMNLFLIFPMLVLLYIIAPKNTKFTSLLIFLTYPAAFFLQANYTETLFIILSVLGLLCIIKKKFLLAAVFCAFLTSLKAVGVSLSAVLAIALLIEYKIDLFARPKLLFKALMLGIISVSGIIIYFSYLTYQYQTPTIYFKAQQEWGRQLGESSNLLKKLFPPVYKENNEDYNKEIYRRIIDPAVFFLSVFLLIKSYKKLNLYLWLFALFNILIPLSTGSLLSFSRLFLLCYPLILYMSELLKMRWQLYLFCSIAVLLQGFAIYLFFNTMFVG
jgi:Gpi18-like mannosyltransferase